jgi:hypothetical protein
LNSEVHRPLLTFIAAHWRGELSLPISVFGVLFGGRLLVAVMPDPGGLPLTLAFFAADTLLLVWQLTGTSRAALRSMADSSDAFPAWGALAAVAVALFVAGIGILDRFAALPPKRAYIPAAILPLPVERGQAVLSGDIDYAGFRGLEAALRDSPEVDTLVLTSDGGLVYAARALARLVAENGLATRVEGRCASACVLVFLAGRPRSLAPGAGLGFHGYAEQSNVPILNIRAEEAHDRETFRAQGITPAFTERVFATPPQAMWFPTEAELREGGVLGVPPG